MRRFRFRLDPVIRVRGFDLDRRRREMALVQGELAKAVVATDEARSRAEDASARLVERAREGVLAGDIDVEQRALEAGYRALDAGERRVVDVRETLEVVRGEVVAARAKLRSLELLRDRAAEAHKFAELRLEQRELDEVAGRIKHRAVALARAEGES